MNKTLSIITFIFSCSVFANSEGKVCVAPSPKPGTKSFYYPNESLPRLKYEIKIGDNDKVEVDSSNGQWIEGFSFMEVYLLSVFEEGKRKSSFKFSFEKYSEEKLCLWLYQPHNTWQLTEMKAQCKCSG